MLSVLPHREYRACCEVWESADAKRLGFQLHSVFGGGGRKLEVPVWSVKLLNSRTSKGTSLLPVYVAALDKNIVLDRSGTFYEEGKLLKMLEQGANPSSDGMEVLKELDSKEKRTQWRQTVSKKRKL